MIRRVPALLSLTILLVPPAVGRRPPPPPDLGTVTLDRADPVVEARVAGVPARLAVVLDDGVFLAPTFADRVPLAWEKAGHEEVGRVRVAVRDAAGEIAIAGVVQPMRVTVHDGPCCGGHDGAIGAADLPWSVVHLGRESARPEQRFPAESDDQSGLNMPWRVGSGTIHVVLSPDLAETVATASAAAILVQTYGGHFEGQARQATLAFGVAREVRDLALDRPASLLGFPLGRIAVRLADFEGSGKLPQDKAGEGILVRHAPQAPQHSWAAITVGRDLLGRCARISVYRDEAMIGLACDPA